MSSFNHYGRIIHALPGLVEALQAATADDALEAMRVAMAAPKHGRHWPELPARSSAPGEAPAIQDPDGGLAADLHTVPGPDGGRLLITSKSYAAELEFGRIDGRVAPRPFMRPAVRAILPKHLKRLAKLLPEAAR